MPYVVEAQTERDFLDCPKRSPLRRSVKRKNLSKQKSLTKGFGKTESKYSLEKVKTEKTEKAECKHS